ncbi:hypothetical protein [Halocella sp. SP3-1]|uniref:hypothetical protein n=1 Tax=Halocella sp. SP3-1 TaxID=2382161 RepID=UPI000F764EFD|nr:hypothetical protein [Halocella sp. SP3-1]AZO95925.1 hypothetical protein D7D81_15750 [Halocella sp. SP3-1]
MKSILNKLICLLSMSVLICLLILITLPVAAHKVILYVYVEGQNVIVEGGFSDGSLTKNAEVKVYDLEDKLLGEGLTDENGIYEFNIPAKTDLRIVLNAGMGHQAEYTISEDELPEINNKNPQETDITAVTAIDEDSLRAIISQELDKKLAPLNKKLSKLENSEGPGITEILGGIGYIFGIMGLTLYFTKGKNKS